MYQFEEQTVELARLAPCPVKVTIQSESLFKNILASARNHPELIEPITVAALGQSHYIVNGHLRARALLEAGRDSARAHIVRAGEISEIVSLHIELNAHGHINSLAMLDAFEFLRGHGREYLVEKRYREAAKRPLCHAARAHLESFLSQACQRYDEVSFPRHVLWWIVSQEDENTQLKASEVLTQSLLQSRRELQYPTGHDLDLLSQDLKLRVMEEQEPLVYRPRPSPKKGAKISREEECLVRGSPTDGIAICPCGRHLAIMGRERRVSTIKKAASGALLRLEEAGSVTPVYAIPSELLAFLGVERGNRVRIIRISSRRDMARLASSLKGAPEVRMLAVVPA
ncbi:MAG: hypothetical protein KGI33_11945 [Thaumarchaeota archaeon]|nr:hypothetical protein [Nitrososphaerota archaeon]